MKKILVTMFLLMVLKSAAFAVDLGNQFKGTLLEHVEPVTQIQNNQTSVALLDSILLIGKHDGEWISGIQAGVSSRVGVQDGAAWLAGAVIWLDPFLRDYLFFPGHWKFLHSVRHGPAIHYNFREKEWRGSYNLGLAFELDPI